MPKPADINIKKLTQHERVVFFRALRLKLTFAEYAKKFGSRNIPHLLQEKE